METPRLDNLLRSLTRPDTRQAENADARLEIRREEKENERKQREKKRRDDDEAADADLPRISVPALKLFLADLLRQSAPPQTAQTQRPATPAGNAAQAYGRNAAPPPPQQPQSGPPAGTPALSAAEVETMKKLQADLAALDESLIPELILRPGENFLASLVAAVQLAKR
jgi:hypothetical protein